MPTSKKILIYIAFVILFSLLTVVIGIEITFICTISLVLADKVAGVLEE